METKSNKHPTDLRMMKRHEIWRMHYRKRRYMEHLSTEELKQRARDVMDNLMVLSADGKLGVLPPNKANELWIIQWTEILEEMDLRGDVSLDKSVAHDLHLPDPSHPNAKAAATLTENCRFPANKYLYKYGKLEHLDPALEEGRLRIAPASNYDDPSLNPAIRDTELNISFELKPSETRLEALSGKTGKSKGLLHPVGNLKFTKLSITNFYVFCLSKTWNARAFIDFDADACLVIKNPKSFLERLVTALQQKLPDWSYLHQSVEYVDPLNPKIEPDVYFGKHFRYSYQDEYRIVWLPPNPVKHLDFIFIDIGGLQDYCEIRSLSDSQY